MLHTMRQGIFSHLRDLVNELLIGKNDLIGIEIGSYQGESAEILLSSGAFKKLSCIDPWVMDYDPSDTTGDAGIFLAEEAFDKRFKDNPVVTKLKMMSNDAVGLFEDNSIDFIYIDGNHQYAFVKQDLENFVPKIKVGGIIAGHDYGGPTTPGVTKAIEEFFGGKPEKVYPDFSWACIKK